MQLLEDDYLGGLGSRGSGKVRLGQIQVLVRGSEALAEPRKVGEYATLAELTAGAAALTAEVRSALGV
jgi:CRISPR-associated protein Csm3